MKTFRSLPEYMEWFKKRRVKPARPENKYRAIGRRIAQEAWDKAEKELEKEQWTMMTANHTTGKITSRHRP